MIHPALCLVLLVFIGACIVIILQASREKKVKELEEAMQTNNFSRILAACEAAKDIVDRTRIRKARAKAMLLEAISLDDAQCIKRTYDDAVRAGLDDDTVAKANLLLAIAAASAEQIEDACCIAEQKGVDELTIRKGRRSLLEFAILTRATQKIAWTLSRAVHAGLNDEVTAKAKLLLAIETGSAQNIKAASAAAEEAGVDEATLDEGRQRFGEIQKNNRSRAFCSKRMPRSDATIPKEQLEGQLLWAIFIESLDHVKLTRLCEVAACAGVDAEVISKARLALSEKNLVCVDLKHDANLSCNWRISEPQIRSLFKDSSGTRYAASRIELCNSDLVNSAAACLHLLAMRRGNSASSLFNPSNSEDPDKAALIEHLKQCFETKGHRANVLLCWHGPNSEATARSIARTGFAALSQTDPGYYGRGRYASLEAEYACLYASEYPECKTPNARGEWPVLLVAGVIGLVYPITPCAEDFDEPLPPNLPDQCKYFGAPMKAKYDTHIVPVAAPSYLCVPSAAAEFHEIAFDQDAQMLPLAIVWFRRAE